MEKIKKKSIYKLNAVSTVRSHFMSSHRLNTTAIVWELIFNFPIEYGTEEIYLKYLLQCRTL